MCKNTPLNITLFGGPLGGGLEGGGVEADRNKIFHSNISVPLLICLLRLGKICKEKEDNEMYRKTLVSEKSEFRYFFTFFLEKIKKTYKFAMSYLIMGNHIQKVRHYINKKRH